jgi:DMSO/TMAO reductase YedYZ heme-binding membrane subunit
VLVAVAAAGVTGWIDVILSNRVANGTDHAVRLAAILTYVGTDGSYTLARACGITALLCGYVSMVMGLLAGRLRVSEAPSRWPEAIHRQAGLVTLALVTAHAVLPYTSVYPPYGGWRTSFLPFGQPVSWGIRAASWESLGILAFYLLILTGPTYYLVGRFRRGWSVVHRLAAGIYALSVAHAFLLGTDFLVSGPARVALLAGQVPLLALVAARLARGRTRPGDGPVRRRILAAAALAAGGGSVGMAVLAGLIAAGTYSPGLRL